MLAHARKSLDSNADLSACVSVPFHGWVERERRERESRKGPGECSPSEDHISTLSNEDISRIAVDFQKAHPNIKLGTRDDHRGFTVRVLL